MSLHPRRALRLAALLLAPAWLVALAPVGCGREDPLAEVRRLHAARDFASSLEPLRELLAARPDDAELNYLYGVALVRSQQPSLAVWSLRRAMEDPKWLAPAGIELAAGAMATGNPDEAVEVMGRVVAGEPENVRALVVRAEARLSSRRDYEGALADADLALRLDPDEFDALVARATALLGLERVQEADATLADLEARVSEADLGLDAGAKFCLVRASFTIEKGERAAAGSIYEKCLREFPSDGRVIQAALAYYEAEERPERAIEILREALALDPLDTARRVLLSSRLERAGEREEAERLLREGTQVRDPHGASIAWIDLANLYTARGEFRAAADALGQAIELTRDPRPELLFQHAETLVMAGDTARAREVAATLGVPAHRELIEARALLKEKQPAQALGHFEAGLRLWPDNAVARYYAAIAAERLGDFDRAIAEYRYSIRAGAAQTDARARLARLHEAEHAYPLAVGVGTQQSASLPPDPDAERVALRILARAGRLAEGRRAIARYVALPETWGKLVAAMAEGTREHQGPAQALKLIREAERLDLTDPRNADALGMLIALLGETGDHAGALAAADAASAAHPDVSGFHALRGAALARQGGRQGDARAAFEKALALDAANAAALSGLAELAVLRGETAAALDLYARASAASRADFPDPEPRRAFAELLVAQGRREEAEARLAELLEHNPYDGAAAARLVALRLEREAVDDDTLAQARRAARFARRPEDWETLARVHRLRGEAKQADEALARAEAARGAASAASERG